MNVISKGGLLLLILVGTAPASASDWWIILQRDVEGNSHLGETGQLRREGDRVLFWTHLFYQRERDGMKSARIQYEVHCSTRSMRERRFVDFDRYRNMIRSGDNSSTDPLREVAPDTTGAIMVDFACMSASQRRERFLSMAGDTDVFDIGEFFSDPRRIVEDVEQ